MCGDICRPPKHLLLTSKQRDNIRALLRQNHQYTNLPTYLNAIYTALEEKFTSFSLRQSEYELIQTKFNLLDPIRKACLLLNKKTRAFSSCSPEILQGFNERAMIVAQFVLTYKESQQQRNDISIETTILKLMAEAIVKACNLPLDKTGRKFLNDAFEVVRKNSTATKEVRNEFSRLTSVAYRYKYAKREMSLAIGYQRGKWTTCFAGHSFYVVDYGIMQQYQHPNTCPKCESPERRSKKCTIM